MSLQTAQPLERLRATATHRSLRELTRMATRGDMTLDAPYQRGTVWTPRQRVGLIRSLLLGVPIPAVVINDRGNVDWEGGPIGIDEPFYAVIDGKQRIETMVMWFASEFLVPASWWDPSHVETTEDTDDGRYLCHAGLTRAGQRIFENNANIALCEGKLPTLQAEAEVFGLVNGEGTPMTVDDMARASAVAEENQP